MRLPGKLPLGPFKNTFDNPYGRLWSIVHEQPKRKKKELRRAADLVDPRSDALGDPETLTSDAYVAILEKCIEDGEAAALERCRDVELHAQCSGYGAHRKLGVLLVQMYAQSGEIDRARAAFDRIRIPGDWKTRDTLACNLLISAYARRLDGGYDDALLLFNQMPQRSLVTWNALLAAAAAAAAASAAASAAAASGYPELLFWFQRMPEHGIHAWNLMLAANAQNGHHSSAFELFQRGLLEGAWPERKSFLAVLQSCRSRPRQAPTMECLMLETEVISDLVTRTTLVDIYGKCGRSSDAKRVFDYDFQRNVLLWNSALSAFAKKMPDARDAKQNAAHLFFWKMPEHGLVASTVMISAYAQAGHINEAAAVFERCPDLDHLCWCTMAAAYAQNGHLLRAKCMFESGANRLQFDQQFWNTMVVAYAQNGHATEALHLLRCTDLEGGDVTGIALSCVLHSCAHSDMFNEGKILHRSLVGSLAADAILQTSILNLYGRSGDVRFASDVFDATSERSSVTWASMLAAYAQNGHCKAAFSTLWLMLLEGIAPDQVTFISVLRASSAETESCQRVFQSMVVDHGLFPVAEHYKCVVDHLGRCGKLDEAEELLERMPFEPDEAVLTSLLSSCRLFKDPIRIARRLSPDAGGHYVLLSNAYR